MPRVYSLATMEHPSRLLYAGAVLDAQTCEARPWKAQRSDTQGVTHEAGLARDS